MITVFHDDEIKTLLPEDEQHLSLDGCDLGREASAFSQTLKSALADASTHFALVRRGTEVALFRVANICGPRLLLAWPNALEFVSAYESALEHGVKRACDHFGAFCVQYRVPVANASTHLAARGFSLRMYVCETMLEGRTPQKGSSSGHVEYVAVRGFKSEMRDFLAARELFVRRKAPGTTFLSNDKFPVILDEYADLLDSGVLNGILAIEKGTTVGLATWVRLSEEFAQGTLFWVSPLLQGGGVGKELARRAFDQASEDCRLMRSVISSANPRSLGAVLSSGAHVDSLVFVKEVPRA